MKKSTIGIIISIVGLFIMGISIGSRMNGGESNLGFTIGGLFIVFLGFFMVILSKKKKSDN